MDAETYHQSLLSQGYSAEQAIQYTQQHYPGFQVAVPQAIGQTVAPSIPAMGQMAAPILPLTSQESASNEKRWGPSTRVLAVCFSWTTISMLLIFIFILIMPTISDNIDDYSDDGGSADEKLVDALGNTRILTYLQVLVLLGAGVVSVLILKGNAKWWWLPAALSAALPLFMVTAMYTTGAVNEFYDSCDPEEFSNCGDLKEESMFEADAMLSAYLALPGTILVTIFSFFSRPREANASKPDKRPTVAWVVGMIFLLLGSAVTGIVSNAIMNPVMG